MSKPIGHLVFKQTSVEWKIENFVHLNTSFIKSPKFQLSDANFYIEMFIRSENANTQLVNESKIYFSLAKESSSSEVHIKGTMGLKKSVDGSVFKSFYFNHRFSSEAQQSSFDELFTRPHLFYVENLFGSKGTLTVFCEARVADNFTAEAETQISVPNTLETLSRNYESMYVSGCNTDAMIEVKGKKFSVHRSILSAQSSVFRSIFELDMKEKETGSVNITDCDPESFGAFLLFLYSGKLDVVASDNVLNLYVTAEKYNVQDLKTACCEYMIRDLCIDSFCDVVYLAALYDEQELLTSATAYFIKNANKILNTSKWLTFAEANFTLANELFIKMTENLTNNKI